MQKGLNEIALSHKIIAHRGCWDKKFPENSLPALKKAADKGYGIELDVHLTKDNQVIVFHDHSLSRMCKISGRIEETDYEVLKSAKLKNSPYSIPTLEEVLKAVDGRVPLYIELKCKNNGRELADALLALLKTYEGDVVFVGFEWDSLKYLQARGYLVCASSWRLPEPPSAEFMPDGMLTYIDFTPRREAKLELYPPFISWTVDFKRQRRHAEKLCPAAIYNTKRFKDLR